MLRQYFNDNSIKVWLGPVKQCVAKVPSVLVVLEKKLSIRSHVEAEYQRVMDKKYINKGSVSFTLLEKRLPQTYYGSVS